jgi:TRAP-type C4-dicarboxylate transport system substrate-binding protein
MKDSLISKNRVKVFMQLNGMRVSKDLYDALDKEVRAKLLKAKTRATKNNRSTIMPQDL